MCSNSLKIILLPRRGLVDIHYEWYNRFVRQNRPHAVYWQMLWSLGLLWYKYMCIYTDCTFKLDVCDKHLCLFCFSYRFTLHRHRWIKIDVTTLHFVSCDPHFVPAEVEACQAVWPVQRGQARYCRALRGNGRWCLQEGTGCREWVGIDQLPLWCHGGKVGIKWSIYMETSCLCVFYYVMKTYIFLRIREN